MACEHCGGTGTITWPSEDGGSPPMVCPHCDKLKMVVCEICNGNGEYSVNSGGPDGEEYVQCDNCDGKGQYPEVYCHACSVSGCADRAIYHSPPACAMNQVKATVR